MVPASHVKGPFSVKKPDKDEQPGPPLNQIAISLSAKGFVEGKYQKKSSRVSLGDDEMGRRPAYDSPTSKGTSGMPVPLTANSVSD